MEKTPEQQGMIKKASTAIMDYLADNYEILEQGIQKSSPANAVASFLSGAIKQFGDKVQVNDPVVWFGIAEILLPSMMNIVTKAGVQLTNEDKAEMMKNTMIQLLELNPEVSKEQLTQEVQQSQGQQQPQDQQQPQGLLQ